MIFLHQIILYYKKAKFSIVFNIAYISIKSRFFIKGEVKKENFLNELSLDKHYEFYEKQGLEKKEIIKRISKDRGVNKNEIYKKFI